MHLEVRRLTLRTPLRTAWGELRERELLELRLGDGVGEAAPLEPYDGVSLSRAREALEAYPLDTDDAELLAACRRVDGLPQALAAVDLALWDQRAKRAGRSIAELIADQPLAAVPVNGLVGGLAPEPAAERAAALAARGVRCVKVKVGLAGDAERVAAVRAAVGPGVLLRVDANGAWESVERARRELEALAPFGLELCEEPVHGVARLSELRAVSPVPIAMDETLAPGSGAADYAVLKIAACGGISGVLEAAAAARAAGTEPFLASTFDGPVGIAAALQAAAALRVTTACGLLTLGAFVDFEDPPLRDGAIALA